MHPAWREIFGSAGRAASAMANMGAPVELHSYLDTLALEVLEARGALEGFRVQHTPIPQSITFDYRHGLATPIVQGQGKIYEPLSVASDYIVRIGMLEGDAIVHADRVVYDPQNAVAPKAFHENGSTANELALVLNRHEAELLTGIPTAPSEQLAELLIKQNRAQVVVIKQGPLGALVHDGQELHSIPAYRSQNVWKLGSGDNFVAHFAFRWIHECLDPAESADLASRATAYYCQTRGFATPEVLATFKPDPIAPSSSYREGRRPSVYLAGPFFTLAQLWLVEQARHDLRNLGLNVFSPYHEVGHGSPDDVVKLDLAGIDAADLVFAIGDGMDSGTIYEIGYARAMRRPVVVYCENEPDDRKKMMRGSDCTLCDDYVSAIYHTLWAASAL